MYFPPNRKFLNIKQSTRISNKKAGKSQPLKEIQNTGLSISIASTKIKEVTEAKFLGVWFDPMLTWNVDIKAIRNKLMSSMAIIKRILPCIKL